MTKRWLAIMILLQIGFGPNSNHDSMKTGKHLVWKRAADLNVSSAFHSAVVLADGRVLLVGGVNIKRAKRVYLDRSEIYDSAKDTWTPGPAISQPRAAYITVDPHSLTVLNDGRVLLAGGRKVKPEKEEDSDPILPAEIFDPKKNTWTKGGALGQPRTGHVAMLLQDGRILVAGRLKMSEIYDPKKDAWTEAGEMPYETHMPRGIVLKDGRVLITGGYNHKGRKTWRDCAIYDPRTAKWSETGTMHHGRSWHMITLLQDGRVLVGGGYIGNNKDTEEIEATKTAEIYDPRTGTWTETGPLHDARYDTQFLSLPDGRVFVAAGATGALTSALDTCEIYDTGTGTWSRAGKLSHPRRTHATILLPNGSILLTGGFTSWFKKTYADCEIGMWREMF